MAVRSHKEYKGKSYFVGDYLTQRARLDDAIREVGHLPLSAQIFEIADYKLELENDANEAAQRLGLIHTWHCDGCPIRCKYCAINFPGQNPWK